MNAEIVSRLEASLDEAASPAIALTLAEMKMEAVEKGMLLEGRELAFVSAVMLLRDVIKRGGTALLAVDEKKIFDEMVDAAAILAVRQERTVERAELAANKAMQKLRDAYERFNALQHRGGEPPPSSSPVDEELGETKGVSSAAQRKVMRRTKPKP